MLKRIHIILSGKVQAVSLRDFIRKEAQRLNIVGFVRNLHDGTVEVVGEGEDDKLKVFERECKRGSLLAFIKSAEVKQLEPDPQEYEVFSIRF